MDPTSTVRAAVAVGVDDDAHPDGRPEKRQRVEEEQHEHEEAHDDGGPAPPPPQQLSQALHKIANYISNSAKFAKASQLLRQVMDAVDKSHSDDFFAAVKAAFTHPEHCIDPLLRKDYVRLMKAVNLRSDVFSKQQRAQLEVYSTLALTQNELFTDDSFVFNKVIAKIKAAISELPDGDEEQLAAWVQLFPEEAAARGITAPQQRSPAVAAAAASSAGAGSSKQLRQRQPAAAAKEAAAAEEADPFGLDAFIAKAEADAAAEAAAAAASGAAEAAAADAAAAGAAPESSEQEAADASAAAVAEAAEAPAAAAPAKPKLTWDPASCLVMKKQALLSCIETAKVHQHKFAWARTSIEILIEDVAKSAAQGGLSSKFVGGQTQQLQELLRFVNSERAARRSGVNRRPGGKGTGEYQTSFEKARSEWGSADWVSARGKVGGQGDGKQMNWLG